jgi:hypothetical protein
MRQTSALRFLKDQEIKKKFRSRRQLELEKIRN